MLLIVLLPVAGMCQDDDEPAIIEAPENEFEQLDPGFRTDLFRPGKIEWRQVPDSTVARLQKEEAFAYANDEEYWKNHRANRDEVESAWEARVSRIARGIIYTILVIVFVFILYRIVTANKLYWSPARRKRSDVQAGDEDDLLSEEDIDEKIRKAAAAKEYRTAVRFMYLKGLRLLSDKGWLRLHAQATNHDYVHQVSRYPAGPAFRFLTDVYDYVWYGEFAVSDAQYERLQSEFQQFYQSLKS